MRSPRLTGATLLTCGLALAASCGQASAADSFASPSAGDRLQPGSFVDVAWTLDSSVVDDRDEMELVLSLDGGATFPIRVSDRLEPEARNSRWRVPAFPSVRARLALRGGNDEEQESERVLLISEPFSIDAPGSPLPEEIFLVGTEYRTPEALEGAPVQASPSGVEAGTTRGELGRSGVDLATLEDGPLRPELDDDSPAPRPRPTKRSPPRSRPLTGASRSPAPLRL